MNLFLPPLKFSAAHFECNIASKVLQHPVMGSKCFCMPLVLIIFSCKIVVNLSVHILDFNFILLSLEMQKNTPRCKKIRLICLGAEKGFNGKNPCWSFFAFQSIWARDIGVCFFTYCQDFVLYKKNHVKCSHANACYVVYYITTSSIFLLEIARFQSVICW